jgi:hypothetical protein
MRRKKVKETMSIVTVVSLERSSKCDLKIGIARTAGSMVTLTSVGSVTKGGTNFIPSRGLRRMLETNGKRAIEGTQGNGND